MAKLPDQTALIGERDYSSPRPVNAYRGGIAEQGSQDAALATAQGAEKMSNTALQLGQQIGHMQERDRLTREAVDRARSVNDYNDQVSGELRRLHTEGDFSSVDTIKSFGDFTRNLEHKFVTEHAGDDLSKEQLKERLSGIRGHYGGQAAAYTTVARDKVVSTALDRSIATLSADVLRDPSRLSDAIKSFNADVDNYAPAMTPEKEIDARSIGHRQLAVSAIDYFLDSGNSKEARTLLADTPGIMEMLGPDQGRRINARLLAVERKEDEGARKGQEKITEVETILGRKMSLAERTRVAGLGPTAADRTFTDKINDAESALGRKLTEREKVGLLGVKGEEPQSGPGKILADRQRFTEQYGENSPQVKAFDEAAKLEGQPATLNNEKGIRSEFTNQSKDFVQVRDAFNRIVATSRTPSAAGDIAMIFNFMKMLDPGSTVREGEFATAQNAAGVPDRVRAAYSKLLNGERLAPDTRSDFLGQSESLMRSQMQTQVLLEKQYKGIAERAGIQPDNVIVDYVGPYRAKAWSAQGNGVNPPGTPSLTSQPTYQVDLEGNVIGGQPKAKK